MMKLLDWLWGLLVLCAVAGVWMLTYGMLFMQTPWVIRGGVAIVLPCLLVLTGLALSYVWDLVKEKR